MGLLVLGTLAFFAVIVLGGKGLVQVLLAGAWLLLGLSVLAAIVDGLWGLLTSL